MSNNSKNENSSNQTISTEKIGLLEKELQNKIKSPLPFKSDKSDYLSTSTVANKLFAKLPNNILQTKTTEQLFKITERLLPLLEKNIEHKSDLFIESSLEQDLSSILIVQGDKPFIINTITEIFRDENINVNFLLHPIYNHEGFRISVIYMEFEPLTKAKLELLEQKIRTSLKDLKLATNDFTAMLAKTDTLARIFANPKYRSHIQSAEQTEIADFLKWLCDDAYIFLGYANWKINNDSISSKPESCLGIFSDHNYGSVVNEIQSDLSKLVSSGDALLVTKLTALSTIQRFNRLQNIAVVECGTDGQPANIHAFVGLFTSKALSQESSSVPVIRRKLKLLVETEELYENSFDFKTTVKIIDSMPKDEALRLDLTALKEIISAIVGIQQKNETKVSIRFDTSRRGCSILVILPRDRFNSRVRDRVQAYLEESFGAGSGTSEYHLDLSNKPFARLYFYVPLAQGMPAKINLAKIEKDVAQLSQSWQNYLEEQIRSKENGFEQTEQADISKNYRDAFPEDYQALYTTSNAIHDIKILQNLYNSNQSFTFSYEEDHRASDGTFKFIVYNLERPVTLSRALPIMENMGLEVLSESSSAITPINNPVTYIHRFRTRPRNNISVKAQEFQQFIAPALEAIVAKEIENDYLNCLVTSLKISHKSVTVLRAYCNLLWQVSAFATKQAMYNCLASNFKCAEFLWQMFDFAFNPEHKLSNSERRTKIESVSNSLNDALRQVTDINSDRIIRSLSLLIEHTLRTNFYKSPNCFAIKLHSQKIGFLPNPKPLYEIFVYSVKIQGTHLRMSKVARGGIRWSERYEDFRSEVLGLVKTQKIKNAVIVPSGAKGGFIVNDLPADPKEAKVAVQESYKSYIRSLISLADNITAGKVEHPKDLVIYDEPDPYFVVAADKGTATFSDTANSIAVDEYDFWLGDAFASGGSQGYDHKLYGITAKGAWECVLRHFRDIGIDYENSDFTVIGIGDMSGDVFGNGLLLSNRIKLLAAFNHKHIFIDPSPDAGKSFKERERLFNTPGSQWSDYDNALISKGGGIFNRYAKEITLSPEARTALGLADDVPNVLNGEELIHHILKAPCDLLWNGGIGTYVKHSEEANSNVNDGTNDRVRINANELRAKVIGEGGNLGFTQKARLEYAEAGGRINTDAIDNSAGVDLSDHEVNIKILLTEVERQKLLTREERNVLLKEIAGEVTEHVLSHNKNHALALTLGVQRSQRNIVYFRSLIRELHKLGYINRTLENLPDDEDLIDRAQHKQGLLRSELAVCLAGVKMYLKDVILESKLIKNERLLPFLNSYFPKLLNEKYSKQIKEHQLANNIIATQITNDLVDSMGITFVHRLCTTNGIEPINVITYAVSAQLLLGTNQLMTAIEPYNNFKDSATFISLRRELNTALRHVTSWFFQHHPVADIDLLLGNYQKDFQNFILNIENYLNGEQLKSYTARFENYSKLGLEKTTTSKLAALVFSEHILESCFIASVTKTDSNSASQAFIKINEKLGVPSVLSFASQLTAHEKWDSELLVASIQEIKKNSSNITAKFLKAKVNNPTEIDRYFDNLHSHAELMTLRNELLERSSSASALAVYAKRLQQIEQSITF